MSLAAGTYAGLCLEVERAPAEGILRNDPEDVVVLGNDVSEGPDFAQLGARGYRVFTIYHVDVVAYVSAIYGRGWLAPETTVRWYRRMRGLMPDVAGVIWDKQEASVRHSHSVIVPSEGMR